jgi:signal recognition particle subunit SRP54
MGMLPGVQKIKNQISDAHLDDNQITRQIGIIRSMTPAERRKPDLINGSRRGRIAKGAGVNTADVNNLLKQFKQVQQMMKSMGRGKGGKKGKRPKMPMGMGLDDLPGFPGH